MAIQLDKYQLDSMDALRNGSILHGGVGSGKSRTALAYYYTKIGKGKLRVGREGDHTPMSKDVKLYIITTARKRDSLEWQGELAPFLINPDDVVVDSWNNIKKYIDTKNSFFIFDEQRLVGSGAWVKTFLKIIKRNEWIILSATPGDTWMDYVPIFIANGFFKNRTEFIRNHVVYNPFMKFPKVDRYINTQILEKYRRKILVTMNYSSKTPKQFNEIYTDYDKDKYNKIMKERWNIYKDEPIQNVSELGYLLRRVLNEDPSRIKAMRQIMSKHKKLIVFYNFNYELELLRKLGEDTAIPTAEWNGHVHQPIPDTDSWLYLSQYISNAEAWNCIETNAMVFYSQNYSYKINTQAAGRIDRRNTPFSVLQYYTLMTKASMDLAIRKAIKNKQEFNEKAFFNQ